MKILLPIFMLLFFLYGCKKNNGYQIKGITKGIENGTAYLVKKQYEKSYTYIPVDTATIKNGEFTFSGSVEQPVRRYIKIRKETGDIAFFLENSNITIRTSWNEYPKATIRGSKTQELFEDYKAQLHQTQVKIDSLKKTFDVHFERDTPNHALKLLQKQYHNALVSQMKYQNNYMLSDAPDPLRLFVFNQLRFILPREKLDSLYESLDGTIRNTESAIKLKNMITEFGKVEPGKSYINLTLKDTAGNKVAISDFVGKKYILLYFIRHCPHTEFVPEGFLELYKKYNKKGLQLFGVYLDADRYYWKNIIEKNDLRWPFVSDLKGLECSAYQKYGHYNTLYYYLIDKKGKYVGKYQKKEQIEDKLRELL